MTITLHCFQFLYFTGFLKTALLVLLVLGATGYTITAMAIDFDRSVGVLVFYLLFLVYFTWPYIENLFGESVMTNVVNPTLNAWREIK